jgi:hypothetical protein
MSMKVHRNDRFHGMVDYAMQCFQRKLTAKSTAEAVRKQFVLADNWVRAVMRQAAVELIADMMAMGIPHHTIMRRISVLMDWRIANTYRCMAKARELVKKRGVFLTTEQAKHWVVAMYGGVIADPKTSSTARVAAIDGIADVMGVRPEKGMLNIGIGVNVTDPMTQIVNIIEGRDPLPVVGPDSIDEMFAHLPPPDVIDVMTSDAPATH